MKTTGNSSPLAAWRVISVTASAPASYESWSATRAVSSRNRSSASSGRQVVVAGRHRPQFEQVRPALLAFLRTVGQHGPVARLLQDRVEHLGQWQHSDPGSEPGDQRREAAQRSACPRAQGFEPSVGSRPGSRPSRYRFQGRRLAWAGGRVAARAKPRSGRPDRPACAGGSEPAQLLQALLADAAGRDVENSLEADLVRVACAASADTPARP